MTTIAAEAAAERLTGGRPSRTRALAVATLAGAATGAVVYRLLRSGTA